MIVQMIVKIVDSIQLMVFKKFLIDFKKGLSTNKAKKVLLPKK